jgi:hypothetical protein
MPLLRMSNMNLTNYRKSILMLIYYLTFSVDVDDRSLPVISRLRKDTDHRHNMSDMDHRASQHRNLISLTGSPKIDTDYRSVPSRSNSQGKIYRLLQSLNLEFSATLLILLFI